MLWDDYPVASRGNHDVEDDCRDPENLVDPLGMAVVRDVESVEYLAVHGRYCRVSAVDRTLGRC